VIKGVLDIVAKYAAIPKLLGSKISLLLSMEEIKYNFYPWLRRTSLTVCIARPQKPAETMRPILDFG
jgi:hypothetical protein